MLTVQCYLIPGTHPPPTTASTLLLSCPASGLAPSHPQLSHRAGSGCPQASKVSRCTLRSLSRHRCCMAYMASGETVSEQSLVGSGSKYSGPSVGQGPWSGLARTQTLPWDPESHVGGRYPALRADAVLGLGRPLSLPLGNTHHAQATGQPRGHTHLVHLRTLSSGLVLVH